MDIFKYVDDVVDYYRETRPHYKEIARTLQTQLEKIVVAKSEYTLSVTGRVKSAESLREKLIRNSYYRLHTTKEEIVANIQDVIGLRIECKFTEDEAYVYSLFLDLFPLTDDQIYYYNEDYPKIRFKLSEQQPVKQKNGFDIYKIDGRYEDKEGGRNIRVNFEVQIKSMIDMFWSEIEHKIIYKNPSYFMAQDQVSEAMMSIKENLDMVDRQLHTLYKRYKREDNSQMYYRKETIQTMLSKLVHDIFARKMKSELGFIVQFTEICDSIIEYIFVVNNAAQMEDFGRVMMDTFYLTGNLSRQEISFREPVEIEREISTKNGFIDTMAVTIQRLVNVDFKWHLYFVILFHLEGGGAAECLETFLRYYKGRLASNGAVDRLREVFPKEAAAQIKRDLMTEMAYVFRRHADISLLYRDGIDALSGALSKTVANIVRDKPDWNKDKSMYFLYLNNSVELAPR
ncbi:MAG: hypothetical protein HDQ87_10230 [Clostridia bacterium]|nr:hypothetical protein [Clostridia bacterium]